MADNPRSRARRIFGRILRVVGCLLFLYGLLYLFNWIKAGSVIEREKSKVAQEISELRSQQVMRPNLFDPVEEGNSWDLIEKALEFPMSDEDQDEFPKLRDERSKKTGMGDLDRVLEKYRPAIDALRGAMRRRLVDPVEWRTRDNWWNHGHEDHPEYGRWTRTLTDAAEFRHRQGRTDEAIEFITISLGLADRIWVKGLGSWGHELHRIWFTMASLYALSSMLESHSLDAAQLTRLGRILETLESSRPDPMDGLRRQDLWDRSELIELAEGRGLGIRRWSPLYWMSTRVAVADSLRVQERNLLLRDITHKPLWERQIVARDFHEVMGGGSLVSANDTRYWMWVALDAAQMSLARIAIALARYQLEEGSYPVDLAALVPRFLPSIPPDACTGSPFRYQADRDHALVYSLGADQNDDGGRPNPDGESDEDGDIVWTVKRRK